MIKSNNNWKLITTIRFINKAINGSNSEDTSVDMVGLPTSTNRTSLLTSEMFPFIWTWLTFKVVQIFVRVSRNPKVLLLETIDDQGFCLV
jgi:hypothetical protein